MPEISVIIPYYNDKIEYFDRCINSIIEQSFIDFEIIVINDGSNEEKVQAITAICEKDKRIFLVSQMNQGVSVARNTGTQLAKGKYIVYVDADDILMPYFFEEAYSYATTLCADVLYGFVFRTADELYRPARQQDVEVHLADREWLIKYSVGDRLKYKDREFGRGPWVRFIRQDIAKSIQFPVGVPIMEDILWNIDLLRTNSRKYIVNDVWYLYMKRNESVSYRYDVSIEEKIKSFVNVLKQKLDIEGYDEKKYYYARLLMCLKRYIYGQYFGNTQNKRSFACNNREFNALCKRSPWSELSCKDVSVTIDKKYRTEIVLFRTHMLFTYWTIRKKLGTTLKRMKPT